MTYHSINLLYSNGNAKIEGSMIRSACVLSQKQVVYIDDNTQGKSEYL